MASDLTYMKQKFEVGLHVHFGLRGNDQLSRYCAVFDLTRDENGDLLANFETVKEKKISVSGKFFAYFKMLQAEHECLNLIENNCLLPAGFGIEVESSPSGICLSLNEATDFGFEDVNLLILPPLDM